MSKPMSCPECGKDDQLATTEKLIGLAVCEIYDDKEIVYEGSTNVLWDSSETIGVSCWCGWEYEGDDWIDQLRKEQ